MTPSLGVLGRCALLAGVWVALVGCGAAQAGNQATPAAATPMSIGSGTTMPAHTLPPEIIPGTLSAATGPSQSAQMICSPEIGEDVTLQLKLPAPPPTTSTWANHVFTCTYRLQAGPLVLSVTESGTAPAARRHFADLQKQVGPSAPLRGLDNLGLLAFQTPTGIVAFVKDDKTLQVDASTITQPPGAALQPSQLAYTLATDILGCWNGQ